MSSLDFQLPFQDTIKYIIQLEKFLGTLGVWRNDAHSSYIHVDPTQI